MQTLLGLFLSFVLIGTGTALDCEVCSDTSINCTGSLQTCEAGSDTCVISLSFNTLAGFPITVVNKGCGNSSTCIPGPKYMDLGQGKGIRSSTICCVGNACKTANPQLPPLITIPNGKRCPACYTTSSNSECNDREKVDCVGPEDSCLDMRMTVIYGTSVLKSIQKGCVTQSICNDLRVGETKVSGVRIIVDKVECQAAPNALS